MLNFGRVYPKKKNNVIKKQQNKVRCHFEKGNLKILNFIFLDKERYIKELRELTKSNKTLEKPKKPLTPYMLFVREVSP